MPIEAKQISPIEEQKGVAGVCLLYSSLSTECVFGQAVSSFEWATLSSNTRSIKRASMAMSSPRRKPHPMNCVRVHLLFLLMFSVLLPGAINAVIDTNVTDLHITLTSLHFIRGHCVMAIAICPIQGSLTLVSGSCDAGKSVLPLVLKTET